MGISYNRFVFNVQGAELIDDIPYSVNVPAEIYGAAYVVGALRELEAWAFDTDCNCPQYNPGVTQPPSPPVFPILFSSDLVYGREHFSNELKMFRGDTYSRTFVVIQDGEFYNLTNSDIRMTFKWVLTDDDSDAVIVLTTDTDDGIVITDPVHGEFVFTILPEDTVDLPSHRVDLYYDAQITDQITGAVYTISYGRLMVVTDSSVTVP